MRSSIVVLTAVLSMLVAGCSVTRGSGNVISETREVDGFTALRVSAPVTVRLAITETTGLTIEGDDNLVEDTRTFLEGSTLVVDTGPGTTFIGGDVVIDLSTPSIEDIDVSGSGSVTAAGIDGSTLRLGVSGSGSIEIAGSVGEIVVDVSGSGSVEASALEARTGDVTVSGSGSIVVNAADTLDANVSGSGSIRYLGSPRVESTVSGSGSIDQEG